MAQQEPTVKVGNLVADPEAGSTNGRSWARFRIAENARVQDPATGEWKNGEASFHNVLVSGRQARNVTESLKRGDTVIVAGSVIPGDTYFSTKEGRDVVGESTIDAQHVGPSLRRAPVRVDRTPPGAHAPAVASTPEVQNTGPVVTHAAADHAAPLAH